MGAPSGLWRHRDFMLLWIGQSVSQFGNQFTNLALPLIAVIALGATSEQMGFLAAAQTVPFLLFGLLVGVWVDRHRRKPILIAGDLGRGIVVAVIAGLAFLGFLHIAYLYVFGFAAGVLTVFFDVSYQAYLPSLVERTALVDANSKLEATTATAQVTGPGIAGLVIEWLSAPFAMVFDALSFVFSAGTLLSIQHVEPPHNPTAHASIRADIREGLAVVSRDARLRSIAACTSTSNLFGSAWGAILILFAVRQLGLDAGSLGLMFAVAGGGAVLGALLAGWVADRIGVGHAIVLGAFAGGAGGTEIILTTPSLALPALSAALFLVFFGNVVYNVNQVSLRQALVPLRIQGRMNATMRFLVWGTLPIGSLLGGLLGGLLGLRPTMTLFIVAGLFPFLFIVLSPVRSLKTVPEPLA